MYFELALEKTFLLPSLSVWYLLLCAYAAEKYEPPCEKTSLRGF